MRTWPWKCVCLALLIQVAVGLPTFGTGTQIEKWNEVDDKRPGEKIPDDYMMTLKDPNQKTDEKVAEESKPKVPEQLSTVLQQQKNEENNLPNPVPLRLNTLTTVNVDDEIHTKKAIDALSNPQEKEHEPFLVLRITTVPSHDELPAPLPTPRPPTAGEEEDCECVECEEAIEKQKSGNGNGEELDCQDPEASLSSPQMDSGRDIEISGGIKIVQHSPTSIFGTGTEDKTNFKSNPFSETEEEKMRFLNEKGIPKIIAGIMMKVLDINDEDSAPCNMEESNSQEHPMENQIPSELSSLKERNELPVIKGLLLKPLIPRENLDTKDIYRLMNSHSGVENKMITSLNDLLKNRVKQPPRFLAFPNESYKDRLPPRRFPELDVQSFTRENGLPTLFRERPSNNEFASRFINSLRPNVITSGPPPNKPFNSLGEYREHLRKVDPQMKELMDVVLRQMAGHAAFTNSLE